MKRTSFALVAFAFCSTFVQAKEPSKPTDFSGNWVLNFDQTKNPPAGLQQYSMVVKQDEQRLKVETKLEGDLQATPNAPNSGNNPSGSSRGGYPGGRGGMGGGMGMPGRIGMGTPGGGMGTPRGGGGAGRPRNEGPLHGDVAAYKLYPQSALYRLDGSEATAHLGGPDQTNATSKVERAKNGGVLKLSLVGNGHSGEGGGKIQIKEQWKLSEDRKFLKVDRTIKSPEGSGTAHLVFSKREAD